MPLLKRRTRPEVLRKAPACRCEHVRGMVRWRSKKSSAFDNALHCAKGRKSLLENYLTDSIHVKC